MANKETFVDKNYSIELNEEKQFVLVHPVSEDETYDSFDELSEANPICEEARAFFFGSDLAEDEKMAVARKYKVTMTVRDLRAYGAFVRRSMDVFAISAEHAETVVRGTMEMSGYQCGGDIVVEQIGGDGPENSRRNGAIDGPVSPAKTFPKISHISIA